MKFLTPQPLQKFSVTLAALVIVFGVSACSQEVPLVSESSQLSNETIEEQRAWLEQQADTAVAASEISEGWHQRGHIPEENIAWSALSEDRARVIGRLSPIECAGPGSGALDLGLNNDIELPDPGLAADRMRTFWASEGWTISDISEPSAEEIYFRADREGGAILGFRATPRGLLIQITSTCSANASVSGAFGAPSAANEFEEELATRELVTE